MTDLTHIKADLFLRSKTNYLTALNEYTKPRKTFNLQNLTLDGQIFFKQMQIMMHSVDKQIQEDLLLAVQLYKPYFKDLLESVDCKADNFIKFEIELLKSLDIGNRNFVIIINSSISIDLIKNIKGISEAEAINMSLHKSSSCFYVKTVFKRPQLFDNLLKNLKITKNDLQIYSNRELTNYIHDINNRLNLTVTREEARNSSLLESDIKTISNSVKVVYSITGDLTGFSLIKYGIMQKYEDCSSIKYINNQFKSLGIRLRNQEKEKRKNIYRSSEYYNINTSYLLHYHNETLLQHVKIFDNAESNNTINKETIMYIYYRNNITAPNLPCIFMIDGTIIDKKGTQLILLGTSNKDSRQVIGAAICNSHEKRCYKYFLEYFTKLNVIIANSTIVSDFEMAILSAINELGLVHQACYFHYCQSLERKNLLYTEFFKKLFKTCMKIPCDLMKFLKYAIFVPIEQRNSYFDELCLIYSALLNKNKAASQLLLYTKEFTNTGRYSKYSFCSIVNNEDNTNNFLECRNSSIKAFAVKKQKTGRNYEGIVRAFVKPFTKQAPVQSTEMIHFQNNAISYGIIKAMKILNIDNKIWCSKVNNKQPFNLDQVLPIFPRKTTSLTVYSYLFNIIRPYLLNPTKNHTINIEDENSLILWLERTYGNEFKQDITDDELI